MSDGAPQMLPSIHDSIRRRCIEDQEAARLAALDVAYCMKIGDAHSAVRYQNVAEFYYGDIWMRLAQLIGA